MKKIYFFYLVLFVLSPFVMNAQQTVHSVIDTAWNSDGSIAYYVSATTVAIEGKNTLSVNVTEGTSALGEIFDIDIYRNTVARDNGRERIQRGLQLPASGVLVYEDTFAEYTDHVGSGTLPSNTPLYYAIKINRTEEFGGAARNKRAYPAIHLPNDPTAVVEDVISEDITLISQVYENPADTTVIIKLDFADYTLMQQASLEALPGEPLYPAGGKPWFINEILLNDIDEASSRNKLSGASVFWGYEGSAYAKIKVPASDLGDGGKSYAWMKGARPSFSTVKSVPIDFGFEVAPPPVMGTVHSVIDTAWNSDGSIAYYVSATTVAIEGKNTLSVNVTEGTSALGEIFDIDIYRNTVARDNGRERIQRGLQLPASGVLVYEDTFAEYTDHVGSGTLPSNTPLYYAIKINRTEEFGGAARNKRAYPAIHLPNDPTAVVEDVISEDITLISQVYENPADTTVIIKLDFADYTLMQQASLEALPGEPLYPAGGKPWFINEILLNDIDDASSRNKLSGASVFWGYEGSAYAKIKVPASDLGDGGKSYAWMKGARPSFSTVKSVPIDFGFEVAPPVMGTVHSVIDTAWNSDGSIAYYVSATTVAVEGKNTLSVNVTEGTSALGEIFDIDIYRNTVARDNGRERIQRGLQLPASGVLVYEDTFAEYTDHVGSGTLPSNTPLYYAIKINRTEEFGGAARNKRAYPAIHLPNDPTAVVEDVISEDITLISQVYENPADTTVIIKLDFADYTLMQQASLEALPGEPLYPAGGKPWFINEILLNDIDDASSRNKLSGASVFWGYEGSAYAKIKVPASDLGDGGKSYAWMKGARPSFSTVKSVPIDFGFEVAPPPVMGTVHSVIDTAWNSDGSIAYYVSATTVAVEGKNTLSVNVTEGTSALGEIFDIDIYRNTVARDNGRERIQRGLQLPASGVLVYEDTFAEYTDHVGSGTLPSNTPLYYAIKINRTEEFGGAARNKRAYPAIHLPNDPTAVVEDVISEDITLISQVYENPADTTVIIKLDFADYTLMQQASLEALPGEPLYPAGGKPWFINEILLNDIDDASSRNKLSGASVFWGYEGSAYAKIKVPASDLGDGGKSYAWMKGARPSFSTVKSVPIDFGFEVAPPPVMGTVHSVIDTAWNSDGSIAYYVSATTVAVEGKNTLSVNVTEGTSALGEIFDIDIYRNTVARDNGRERIQRGLQLPASGVLVYEDTFAEYTDHVGSGTLPSNTPLYYAIKINRTEEFGGAARNKRAYPAIHLPNDPTAVVEDVISEDITLISQVYENPADTTVIIKLDFADYTLMQQASLEALPGEPLYPAGGKPWFINEILLNDTDDASERNKLDGASVFWGYEGSAYAKIKVPASDLGDGGKSYAWMKGARPSFSTVKSVPIDFGFEVAPPPVMGTVHSVIDTAWNSDGSIAYYVSATTVAVEGKNTLSVNVTEGTSALGEIFDIDIYRNTVARDNGRERIQRGLQLPASGVLVYEDTFAEYTDHVGSGTLPSNTPLYYAIKINRTEEFGGAARNKRAYPAIHLPNDPTAVVEDVISEDITLISQVYENPADTTVIIKLDFADYTLMQQASLEALPGEPLYPAGGKPWFINEILLNDTDDASERNKLDGASVFWGYEGSAYAKIKVPASDLGDGGKSYAWMKGARPSFSTVKSVPIDFGFEVAPPPVMGTVHSVIDTAWNSDGSIAYYVSATTVAVEGKNTLSVNVTEGTSALGEIFDIDIYRNTVARDNGRERIQRGLQLPASGVLVYEDTFAEYTDHVGSGTLPSNTPLYYAIKINRTEEFGGAARNKRAYPAIHLPNDPTAVVEDVISEDITLISQVYENPADTTVIIKLDFADYTLMQQASLEALPGEPLYPAGGKPWFIGEMFLNDTDDIMERNKLDGASVFWGYEGSAYAKIKVPASDLGDGGKSYLWMKGARPAFSTVKVVPIDFGFESTTTSIKDFVDLQFQVYPNPTSGLLNIELTESINRINLVSIDGRLVYSKVTDKNFRGFTQIDISSLNAGMYFLQLQGKERIIAKKIILE